VAVEKWLGAGVLLQLLACAVVGAKLLGLARRTRQIPELSLGLAFLLLGAVGHPLAIAARMGPPGEQSAVWLTLALTAQNAASFAIYVMNWQTFHKGSRIVAGVVAATALGFFASGAAPWWAAPGSALASGVDAGPAYYLGFGLRFGAFLWAAVDSIRYFRLLGRRQKLGLADPVVVDRFRLWSISTVCICAGFAVFLAGRLLPGQSSLSPWVLACTSVVAGASGVAMWLAFFPPRPYLARVAAHDASRNVARAPSG
jgi:hypothetical protein